MVPFPCAFSLRLEVLPSHLITLSFDAYTPSLSHHFAFAVLPRPAPISLPLTTPGSGPAPRLLITPRLIAHRSAPCTVAQAWLRPMQGYPASGPPLFSIAPPISLHRPAPRVMLPYRPRLPRPFSSVPPRRLVTLAGPAGAGE